MNPRYKYETKDLISSGAFGSVYKAFDTLLQVTRSPFSNQVHTLQTNLAIYFWIIA